MARKAKLIKIDASFEDVAKCMALSKKQKVNKKAKKSKISI